MRSAGGFVDDLTQALNYLHQNQEKLEISTENVVLMGHSAGAFNVMSAVYHPDSTKIECLGKIKAIVGLAGPYHFDYKGDPLAEDAFDEDVSYKEVMPYYFVNQNNIKHYLLMAENDQLVKQHNTLDMDQALREKGAEVIVVPAAFTALTGKAHWQVLLRARAIETQSFIVGAGQCGLHSPSRQTWGHSQIIDPWGVILGELDGQIGVVVSSCDIQKLRDIREQMPILRHRVLFESLKLS